MEKLIEKWKNAARTYENAEQKCKKEATRMLCKYKKEAILQCIYELERAMAENLDESAALPLHGVSNNEALESSSDGVAVKGCHNCKNNPHSPFIPRICDSCYADKFNKWQPLTDC